MYEYVKKTVWKDISQIIKTDGIMAVSPFVDHLYFFIFKINFFKK